MYLENESQRAYFFRAAHKILKELSSRRYLAKGRDAFLQNSVGSRPAQSEVTASLIYTDYFYLEALKKLKEIQDQNSFAQLE